MSAGHCGTGLARERLHDYVSAASADFVALAAHLHERREQLGIAQAVATNSDVLDLATDNNSAETHVCGAELARALLAKHLPDAAARDAFAPIVAYDWRLHGSKADEAGKRYHMRLIAAAHGVQPGETLLVDDSLGNLVNEEGWRGCLVRDPSKAFQLSDLLAALEPEAGGEPGVRAEPAPAPAPGGELAAEGELAPAPHPHPHPHAAPPTAVPASRAPVDAVAACLKAASLREAAPVNVVIVPGNGCTPVRDCNFYGWAERELRARKLDVRLPPGKGMPDPLGARASVWLPFIKNTLRCDARSILVGHSSGAAAGLRWAELNKLHALVLVAAYDDDLGDEGEAASGYFDGPFDWVAIQRNCHHIVQFAGARDSLVPLPVQRRVAKALAPKVVYVELPRRDHFFSPPFLELLEWIDKLSAQPPLTTTH
jgi:predicted alpha/beta hydrolase family esterase